MEIVNLSLLLSHRAEQMSDRRGYLRKSRRRTLGPRHPFHLKPHYESKGKNCTALTSHAG